MNDKDEEGYQREICRQQGAMDRRGVEHKVEVDRLKAIDRDWKLAFETLAAENERLTAMLKTHRAGLKHHMGLIDRALLEGSR